MIDLNDAHFWRTIVETLEVAVIVRDHDGTIAFVNPAGERLGGTRTQEVVGGGLGGRIAQVLGSDGSPLATAELPAARVLETGAPVRDEVLRLETLDHGVRWFAVSAAPVPTGEPGAPAAVVTTAVDVTERVVAERALRGSEERFRSVVATMFAGFAIYSARRDDDGRLVDLVCEYVNDAGVENRGLAPAAQLGRGLLELFPDLVELGLFQQSVRVVETGEPVRLSVPWYESDLVAGAFEIGVSKLGDGCVMVFRDLAEIRRTEAALRAANEELRQLAAAAAHDLAAPLRAVAGFAGRLQERAGGVLDDEARQSVDFILASAKRMRTLIDDLLSYSDADAAPLPTEPVDLARSVKQATETLASLADATGATVGAQRGPTTLTDREREVLRMLSEGASTRRIAERLFISVNTARNHVQRVIRKLDAHSRLEAVATARRAGLLGEERS